MREDTAERLLELLVNEVNILSRTSPAAGQILMDLDWYVHHSPDLESIENIGPATERFFASFGKALGDKVDSGDLISKGTIINVPVRLEDMNTVRDALKWLGRKS